MSTEKFMPKKVRRSLEDLADQLSLISQQLEQLQPVMSEKVRRHFNTVQLQCASYADYLKRLSTKGG